MQEEVEYRDIAIFYRELKLQTRVDMNSIVSEFFKHKLKNFNPDFNNLATEAKLTSFIPLSDLQYYDITLNSTIKGQNSVMNNAGISFGTYDKKKNLRFYVHDMQSNKGCSELQNQKNIVFCLMRGNTVEKQQSVDITGMSFSDFEGKMREIFNIDPSMPVRYKNMKESYFINLNTGLKTPIKIINEVKISKVAVCPVYEAG